MIVETIIWGMVKKTNIENTTKPYINGSTSVLKLLIISGIISILISIGCIKIPIIIIAKLQGLNLHRRITLTINIICRAINPNKTKGAPEILKFDSIKPSEAAEKADKIVGVSRYNSENNLFFISPTSLSTLHILPRQ
jgi:hypothetical protein